MYTRGTIVTGAKHCGLQPKKSNNNKKFALPSLVFAGSLDGSTPPQPGAQLMTRGGSVASVLPVGPVMGEVELIL